MSAIFNKKIIGKRFNSLTVISRNYDFPLGRTYLNCLCDCSRTTIVEGGNLRKGAKTCGVCNRLPKYEASFRVLFNSYKAKASTRNYDFELTSDEARKLFKGNCFYCGCKPGQTWEGKKANGKRKYNGLFKYNGIDRVDNSKGYTLKNSVSCCKKCNYMKHALDKAEFISHIKKIVKNMEGG